MTHTRLILASRSPRRHDFMYALGVSLEVHVADIDESQHENESPIALVERLSREKAQAITKHYPNAVIIGADTIVVLDEHILGKPAGTAEAADMLRRLRNRPHHVYSGIAVCPPDRAPLTTVSDSKVWMRPYSDDELATYVDSGDPLDKAGAYGIQNAAFRPVARLRGCYAGVMGLPLCHLTRLLAQIEITAPVQTSTACQQLTGLTCCDGTLADLILE